MLQKLYFFIETGLLFISICILFLLVGFEAISLKSVVIGHFYLYTLLLGFNFLLTHRITLFQIWIAGFIFIIWSDMMILSQDLSFAIYERSIAFLFFANNTLLLGYLLYNPNLKKGIDKRIFQQAKVIPFLLTVALFIYVVASYQKMILTLIMGRQLRDVVGTTELWSTITDTLGLLIPTYSAYYFRFYSRKNAYISLLWALPVFVIEAVLGTRFRLLFLIMPYCVILEYIGVKYMPWKKIIKLVILILMLIPITNFIKKNRTISFYEAIENVNRKQDIQSEEFMIKLADNMSPEGVVRMTFLANDYFSNHQLMYGKEIGHVLYFMIPRKYWPDKPLPIDHWLIRKYEKVSSTYSTASGFTGEIRADFGMGCFIILFFWGMFLKWFDEYAKRVYSSNDTDYNKILIALIYPYIFFFVRSPLTATYSFIFEVLVYLIIRKMLTKQID